MTASVWKGVFTVAFCMFSFLLHGQTIRLSGIVVNAAEQPLENVLLSLQPVNRNAHSDASGNFQFSNLQPGKYRLSASVEGYLLLNQDVELSADRQLRLMLHERQHQLKEVEVRDNLIQQRKQEESLNVEVIRPDFIQRNLGGSLMKTLERLPGIKTIGIGSGQSKPLIRGLGFNRVVVVDKGVKHEGQQWGADHGLELDQFAAGSVELIKGAAAFVYGSDAIAGAIDVKPPAVPAAQTLGGSVELIGKSNNDQYGTSINLYGRKQQLFFDARITEQRYGDYRVPADTVFVYDYAVPLHNRQLRNTAGRESGLHFSTGYLSDHFRSIFYLSNSYSKSGFFANAHGLEPRRVDEVMHDASSRDIQLPSQKVNHFKIINRSSYQLAAHNLELELGYQRNFREEFSMYVNHGFMPSQYPDSMRIPAELERGFDKRVYTANLRDNISLGKHRLTMGFNLEQQHNSIDGWGFLVPSFDQSTAGAFVYDKLKVNEELLLHGALRFDYGRIRMFEYRDWFPSNINAGDGENAEYVLRAANLNRNFKSLVWSLGMNYNLERLALKANVGKSFRMPIAKELGANGVNYHYFSYERGNADLSPEQSYQLDFSAAWAAERWSLQFSPFYNYFPNYIYLNPTSAHDRNYGAGNQIFEYAQSRVLRYGAELQLKYNFWKSLSTEVLAEYLYSRQLSGAKKGYTLPFSPPASLLLNLSWTPELRGLEGSYLSLDYRMTAAQNKIVPPEKKSPGYQTLNVQAGTKLRLYGQEVQLSLQAQNLLNARYLNHTSFYRLIELPEAGRNLVLSLKLPFKIKPQH
ncbi:TonB-dependent receptor [Pedobacter sp. SAFR-022]|uniref:TonB-dependent receptor n=1 Tax=Pedobacter sp. SAFR-022 TaxID=3436861 RepID=UPI003F7CE131